RCFCPPYLYCHFCVSSFLLLSRPPPPTSTLFPYTTLFRSYELADLGLGRCRMCVAAKKDFRDRRDRTLRVATKFPHIAGRYYARSEEHTSELQSRFDLVCRLLLEKKKKYHSENAQQETKIY